MLAHNWYDLAKMASGVQSVVKTNPKGTQFFTLFGNTFPIKDQLKNLGFRYFQGTWSVALSFFKSNPNLRSTLEGLGVDCSPVDAAPAPSAPQQQQNQPTGPQEPMTPTDRQLAQMKAGVEQAMGEAGNEAKVKGLLSFIDRMIEQVGNQTDEASKGEFVKNFMKFSAKFHNYSFANTMLIFIQSPKATHVAGYRKWLEMGRQVKDWKKAISIIAPRQAKRKISEEQLANMPPDQAAKMRQDPGSYMYFVPTQVFDIADTEPIPGAKEVFEPTAWRKDSNDQLEEVTALVNATNNFAKASNINIEKQEMGGSMGGFSSGEQVRINNTFEGINLFSTTVHEIAHSLLHFGDDRGTPKTREEIAKMRQLREVDAETAAYIVLQHYGFETKDTPNYLALWQANSKDIKARRDNISKAVKQIIHGIDAQMKSSPLDLHDEEAAAV